MSAGLEAPTAAVDATVATIVATHLDDLRRSLVSLERDVGCLERWGHLIAEVTLSGGRVLVAGNGGSAAQAQHLTGALVGRYLGERAALSAIALTADVASVTAIGDDYGYDQVFARQVRAHGRAGDVLVLVSTSGRSPNLLEAACAGRRIGMSVFALTGRRPNPLAEACDEALGANASSTAVVQEVHQVAIHLLCEAVERVTAPAGRSRR